MRIATLTAIDTGETASFSIHPIPRSMTRVVTRSLTLDGGVVINDNGFLDGNVTYSIDTSDEGAYEAIKAVADAGGFSRLSIEAGRFYGIIEMISESDGVVTVSFLVCKKL